MRRSSWWQLVWRLALVFAVMFALSVSEVPTSVKPAALQTGGYPFAAYEGPGTDPASFTWTDANGQWYSNEYRYGYRNCTDFVAWKLDTANKFSPPKAIGNAEAWGGWARTHGYTVNMEPAVGAVAWWDNTHSNGFGHVAWVQAVTGDNVVVEEFNYDLKGNYNVRTISRSVPTGYIHFMDISNDVTGLDEQSPAVFTGAVPDGAIVDNIDGGRHLYVAAGGSLFWFERGAVGEYLNQARRRYAPGQIGYDILPMRNADVHDREANYPFSRAHPPRDGTFMHEQGSGRQYIMQFGYAFVIASVQEIDILGGRDKAIMVPPGSIGGLLGTPSIPHNLMPQAVGDSTVYHSVNGGLHTVSNQTVLECIRMTRGGRVLAVAASVITTLRSAGQVSAGATTCIFPSDWALYVPGQSGRWRLEGSNPYVRRPFLNPLALRCRLGTAPREVQISTAGLQPVPVGATLGCQDGAFVRTPDGATYRVMANRLQPIRSPEVLNCLMGSVDRVIAVEQPVLRGVAIDPPVSCSFEGRMIRRPDGRVALLRGGKLYWVGNSFIQNCIKVRGKAGDPIAVTAPFYAQYAEAGDAFCPYAANIMFVRGEGQSAVWRVYQDGTRQVTTAYCRDIDPAYANDPRYTVYVVPSAEIAGHRIRQPDVFAATVQSCRSLS